MINDGHLAEHLTNDDLDVLIVDRHTLRAVHALHALNEVLLHGTLTGDVLAVLGGADLEDVLRVERSREERLAELNVISVCDEQGGTLQDRVRLLFGAVVRHEENTTALLGVLDHDAACGLGDRGRTLRGTCFEELLHAGQTLRDVVSRRGTTGVEGTHRQLGTGLTNRLCRDDADGLADVDALTGRERAAVAGGADANCRLARQDRAHLDLDDATRNELLDRARRRRPHRPKPRRCRPGPPRQRRASGRRPSSQRSRRPQARRWRPEQRSGGQGHGGCHSPLRG